MTEFATSNAQRASFHITHRALVEINRLVVYREVSRRHHRTRFISGLDVPDMVVKWFAYRLRGAQLFTSHQLGGKSPHRFRIVLELRSQL